MTEHEKSIREALHEYASCAVSLGSDAGKWSAAEARGAIRLVADALGLSLDEEGACTVRREATFPPEYEATGELTLASQMDRDEEG
jgi:hypothetical protein